MLPPWMAVEDLYMNQFRLKCVSLGVQSAGVGISHQGSKPTLPLSRLSLMG